MILWVVGKPVKFGAKMGLKLKKNYHYSSREIHKNIQSKTMA
jgi:hypothetical protein